MMLGLLTEAGELAGHLKTDCLHSSYSPWMLWRVLWIDDVHGFVVLSAECLHSWLLPTGCRIQNNQQSW